MHVWRLENWTKHLDLSTENHKKGLRMRFDNGVSPIVREFCIDFAKWMRKEFSFPIRVNVYVKAAYRIKARDGEPVIGTFWWPHNYGTSTYARIATGDYFELLEKRGEVQAMWAILRPIAHELTHYFQYVNKLSLTKIGEERQATVYSDYILTEYNDYLKQQGSFFCVE